MDDQLLDRELRAARRAAERARQWLDQLQHVAGLLGDAVTAEEVADVILDQGLSFLGARQSVLVVLAEDGHALTALGSRGDGEGLPDHLRQSSLDATVPLVDAIRSGAPVWIEDHRELMRLYPAVAEQTRRSGTQCVGAVPLSAKHRTFGALAFDFDRPRCFQEGEKEFLLHLGRQCAQALERTRLLREAREAALRAEEATRAKDEFLSVVSHELRTPLNAILGWCHMMETMREHNPTIVERGLAVITRNARAQVTIIEDILEMSRIITGKFRLSLHPVDLRAVVLAAVESVRPTANMRSLSLDLSLTDDAQVLGDGDRLQQVVWNLLSNAMKFTPPGGRITTELVVDQAWAKLTVRDTGQGIAARDLDYVFDRFRQVDSSVTRSKGGLGLGLAIVRHLVEAHGGRVRAESGGPGQGAAFEVLLPTNRDLGEFEPRREERPSRLPLVGPLTRSGRPEPVLAGARVLVVDDEADSAEMVSLLLAQHGASVQTASSAFEALRLLQRSRPDLLVSDIGMPEMDGLTLLRRVRELPAPLNEVPAIALSAYASSGDAAKAEAAGYVEHIPKPLDPARLIRVVAQALGR